MRRVEEAALRATGEFGEDSQAGIVDLASGRIRTLVSRLDALVGEEMTDEILNTIRTGRTRKVRHGDS